MSEPSAPDPSAARAPLLLLSVRRSLLVSLLGLTLGAWAVTVWQALPVDAPMDLMMGGMGPMGGMVMSGASAADWSVVGAVLFLALWTVMMTAMMLPAAAPMILMFASAQARRTHSVAVPTWIFVAGYLLVWMAAGVLVYVLVQLGSEIAARIAVTDRAGWARLTLGTILIAAGLYQFTALKRVCLSHCRSPLAFIALYWKEGRLGALSMGFRHGVYCLGCCWALFAVLVAAGIMSMAWMLLLTLLVFTEKVLPYANRFSAVIGVAMIAVGLVMASEAIA